MNLYCTWFRGSHPDDCVVWLALVDVAQVMNNAIIIQMRMSRGIVYTHFVFYINLKRYSP